MSTTELASLVPGQTYRVRIRNWCPKRQQHKPGRALLRRFIQAETRFGSIPCAVFTSAIRRRSFSASLVSVPHYDLISAERIAL